MGNVSGCYKNSDKNVITTTSTETGNDYCDAQTPPTRVDESQPDESSPTKCNKSPKISSSYASTVSSDAPTRRNYGNYRYHNSNYNRGPNVGAPGTGMSGNMGGGFGGGMGGGGIGGGGAYGGGGACGGGGC